VKADAQVLVLYANNEKKGIDPRIGKLPQLKKPPFSSFKGYTLLSRKTLPLKQGDTGKLTLPDKAVLKVGLKGRKKVGRKHKYVVTASIAKPKGKKFLRKLEVRATPKVYFFVAGQAYKKGILVLGIRMMPK